MTAQEFRFRDLGKMQAKGFDKPDRVHALLGEEAGAPEQHEVADREGIEDDDAGAVTDGTETVTNGDLP